MKKYTKKEINEMFHRVFLLTMLESRAHPWQWESGAILETEQNIINYIWATNKGGK